MIPNKEEDKNFSHSDMLYEIYIKKTPLVIMLLLRFPEVLVLFVLIYYSYTILADLSSDTTIISNAAFVICATIAALAFGFAQVIDKNDDSRERVIYSGERFFHASIFLILASIIKYAVIKVFPPALNESFEVWQNVLRYGFGFFSLMLFTQATLVAHTGIKVLNEILIRRMARIKDWDNFF